jgi:hypothetical protein
VRKRGRGRTGRGKKERRKIDVLERDAALWKEPAREIQKSRIHGREMTRLNF